MQTAADGQTSTWHMITQDATGRCTEHGGSTAAAQQPKPQPAAHQPSAISLALGGMSDAAADVNTAVGGDKIRAEVRAEYDALVGGLQGQIATLDTKIAQLEASIERKIADAVEVAKAEGSKLVDAAKQAYEAEKSQLMAKYGDQISALEASIEQKVAGAVEVAKAEGSKLVEAAKQAYEAEKSQLMAKYGDQISQLQQNIAEQAEKLAIDVKNAGEQAIVKLIAAAQEPILKMLDRMIGNNKTPAAIRGLGVIVKGFVSAMMSETAARAMIAAIEAKIEDKIAVIANVPRNAADLYADLVNVGEQQEKNAEQEAELARLKGELAAVWTDIQTNGMTVDKAKTAMQLVEKIVDAEVHVVEGHLIMVKNGFKIVIDTTATAGSIMTLFKTEDSGLAGVIMKLAQFINDIKDIEGDIAQLKRGNIVAAGDLVVDSLKLAAHTLILVGDGITAMGGNAETAVIKAITGALKIAAENGRMVAHVAAAAVGAAIGAQPANDTWSGTVAPQPKETSSGCCIVM